YYALFAGIVRTLRPETDYVINEKDRIVTLTEEGIAAIERKMGFDNLYSPEHFEMIPYLDNALRANVLYRRDKDYIVRDGHEVVIVDEFTGRLMDGRRYSEGLHQAIEAKEGVKVQKESMTLATITFQNFFRMYNKLAGMTGTAKTEEEEFQRIYNLDVVMVPTHRPVVRQDLPDLVYRGEEGKFKAVLEDISQSYERKQPVLLGTVAIETSERLSGLLKRMGIPHEVLNAKNHEREATIIAQAGRPGAVTIATNMAGRGVDILLGGNAEGLARDQLRKEGVELGEVPQRAWNDCLEMAKHGRNPTEVYNTRWAQVLQEKFAETEQNKRLVQELGGLHVVGTERHEARRIDNQLRGRSGRLGDPGSSRFYLSMEDELMRRFGGERMGSMMDRLGLEEDMPIEAGIVTKAIESAQTRVEGYNFDTRKHVLQYDEVVNEQRNRIYEQRRRILTEPSLQTSIVDMIGAEVSDLVAEFTQGEMDDEWQLNDLALALKALCPLPPDITTDLLTSQWREQKRSTIEEHAVQMAMNAYAAKETQVGHDLMRQVERQLMLRAVDMRWIHHLTDLDHLREGIGLRAFAQVDPLVAYKREAFNMYAELMDDIRGDIVKSIFAFQLQQPGAAPATTRALPTAAASPQPAGADGRSTVATAASVAAMAGGASTQPVKPQVQSKTLAALESPLAKNVRTNRDSGTPQTVKKSGPQLGRNDPCWCGSGKKYKACHMQSDQAQAGSANRVPAK
ncbi:MAG: SEC-C metal-binding domain-containing protein, partial [Caldilineaceae bacterium]